VDELDGQGDRIHEFTFDQDRVPTSIDGRKL
jgi:hypothetical protein